MRVLKVKVISLQYIFQVLYVLCFTRPRYQVSVYRTIGPLVFCFCEKDAADQLLANCTADKRLCFCYTDSKIHLLPKSESSRLPIFFGLSQTW